MSKVSSTITSAGGNVTLNYAGGATTGNSNTLTLKLKIGVNPSDDVPKAVVTLELPAGHFSFDNTPDRQILTKELGKVTDGQEVEIDFKIDCDIASPPTSMAMTIETCDKYTNEVDKKYHVYTVKKS